MDNKTNKYYLPSPSSWPLIGSIALFCTLAGIAHWLHEAWYGPYLTLFGFFLLVYTIHGWFGEVIHENRQGLLSSEQVEHSFRLGMFWFIFSEAMFFGAFFGALFYIRVFVIPDLGDPQSVTHILLWPDFTGSWPLFANPDPSTFAAPQSVMNTWGIPAINTLVLLTSAVTITIAHWALLKGHRQTMLLTQLLTILLGITFLILQANEYGEAYFEKSLTLASGIYGTTFFMLTGFHGLHVTIGTIALCVIFYRMLKRDFTPHNLFAFEAISWYWHFVDIVWLLLFVFVYWI
ncbi:cytochrome c oxidase subunit 3 [Aquicella lusitana]|uniref:cytochrome-c oxidase n=1 Tax=Aquicella lusitana TaxID=254246 RepID=A0A370GLU2_9COXI|nr:cytochrome c oxidase subunit 3 [Aquicella lusitana]RDI43364.1 cytochrome c oxidase subunit 3 [Aquicella lusitana]VVC73514.1 Cytochrome c oxidase subunit 3 [Aquicella lusitana]